MVMKRIEVAKYGLIIIMTLCLSFIAICQDGFSKLRGFITINISGYSGITVGFPVYVTNEQMNKIICKGEVGRYVYGKGNYFLSNIPQNKNLLLICFSPDQNFLLGIVPFTIKSTESEKRVDLQITYNNSNIGMSGDNSGSSADAFVNLVEIVTSFFVQKQINKDVSFNKKSFKIPN
jgi:hypothetical protein